MTVTKRTIEKTSIAPATGITRSHPKIAANLKKCAAISIYLAGFVENENSKTAIKPQSQTLEGEL